jgi:hypothetical protein
VHLAMPRKEITRIKINNTTFCFSLYSTFYCPFDQTFLKGNPLVRKNKKRNLLVALFLPSFQRFPFAFAKNSGKGGFAKQLEESFY